MTSRLKISIDHLYDTFAKYQGNPNMTGSSLYGDLADWNKALFSKPLHKLTSKDLSIFAGKVITTWGDTPDLKHFLPRLFELTALFDTPYDISILYQKLEGADWLSWNTEEQNAVNEFSLALWDNLLYDNSEKSELEFNDYFIALIHFYPAFNDLTEIWQANNSFSSIKHLSNYIYDELNYLLLKTRIKGDEKSIRNIKLLKDWLLSDMVIQKLTDAFFQFEKTELAEKISWALKIIEDEKHSTQQRYL